MEPASLHFKLPRLAVSSKSKTKVQVDSDASGATFYYGSKFEWNEDTFEVGIVSRTQNLKPLSRTLNPSL